MKSWTSKRKEAFNIGVLHWEPIKKLRKTEAHNRMYRSDIGVPGSYVPNMSEEDEQKWKAQYIRATRNNPRVEIRKRVGPSLMVIVVTLEGVTMSMNGKCPMDLETFSDFKAAVDEAITVLVQNYKGE